MGTSMYCVENVDIVFVRFSHVMRIIRMTEERGSDKKDAYDTP